MMRYNSNLIKESRNTEGSGSLLICGREMTMPPGSLLLGCARAMIVEDQTSEYKNGKTEEENQEPCRTGFNNKFPTENTRNNSKACNSIVERGPKKSNHRPKGCRQSTCNVKSGLTRSSAEQYKSDKREDRGKGQRFSVFGSGANTTHIARRPSSYHSRKIGRHCDTHWLRQCRIKLAHKKLVRPKLNTTLSTALQMLFETSPNLVFQLAVDIRRDQIRFAESFLGSCHDASQR